jgi:hypothetical protein
MARKVYSKRMASKKAKKMITAKQKSARRKNIAIARRKRKRGTPAQGATVYSPRQLKKMKKAAMKKLMRQ